MDAFLTDLRRETCPSDVAPRGTYSVRAAAKRACCHSVEVVRLILDRRLGWVGELRGVRGYDAILVKIDEVRREVRGRELDGLLPSAAYKLLRTNWRAVDALVDNGVIRTVVRRHPANRTPVSVITHDEIKRFEARYVSLFEAAQGFGVHHVKLRRFLSERGVEPELTRDKYHASFYRRDLVAGLEAEVREASASLGRSRPR